MTYHATKGSLKWRINVAYAGQIDAWTFDRSAGLPMNNNSVILECLRPTYYISEICITWQTCSAVRKYVRVFQWHMEAMFIFSMPMNSTAKIGFSHNNCSLTLIWFNWQCITTAQEMYEGSFAGGMSVVCVWENFTTKCQLFTENRLREIWNALCSMFTYSITINLTLFQANLSLYIFWYFVDNKAYCPRQWQKERENIRIRIQ